MKEVGNWLYNVWIIEKDSGICIFEQNFKELKVNSDLISGFLVAMLNFGKEIADNDIKSINFQELKIFYSIQNKFLLIIAVKEDTDPKDVDDFLQLISEKFDKEYVPKLEKWDGNTDIFLPFGDYIESLTDKKALKIEILKNKILSLKEKQKNNLKLWLKEPLDKFTSFIENANLEKILDTNSDGLKKDISHKIKGYKGKLVNRLKEIHKLLDEE
ncbi:MAG: hypothetical protein ACTSU2_01855 [Promethearchaeota archaeon]